VSAPGHAFRVAFACSTDIGVHREENQDSYGVFPGEGRPAPDGRIFIVADGMGGHRGGREASAMAVEVVGGAFAAPPEGDVLSALERAIGDANEAILTEGSANPNLRGMGTTCSVLHLHGDEGRVAHVGDSRIYRITPDAITQLTDDHSRVAEMVRRGLLSDEEARWHPERSLLYRALGVTTGIDVDVAGPFPLRPDERYLLCTDGLVNLVTDDEIRRIVLRNPPADACELLTDLALRRGGHDNITIIIVHLEPAS